MTDGNINASKLFEQATGRLDSNRELPSHSGLPIDEKHSSNLSFVESCLIENGANHDLPGRLDHTQLGQLVDHKLRTEAARDAIVSQHDTALSYLVGITERDLDASELTLPAQLLDRLDNDGALTNILAAGNPNTGKTNTVSVLAELAKAKWSDLLIVSNVATWDLTDELATSAFDLATTLIEHRDTPKFVLIDEASTHFDARTKSYEVASQWSPLCKRMSKLNVEVAAVIGHTGKDIDPEQKRLCNLALYKTTPKEAEFFESWPADSDHPDDRLFGGELQNLEATAAEYDPDDAAPWTWNLDGELWSKPLDWPELLNQLRKQGPDE